MNFDVINKLIDIMNKWMNKKQVKILSIMSPKSKLLFWRYEQEEILASLKRKKKKIRDGGKMLVKFYFHDLYQNKFF